MLRRDVIKAILAMAAMPSVLRADEPGLQTNGVASPFDAQTVTARARALASAPFQARPMIPEAWRKLSYDQFRHIWFDSRNALWENTDLPQRADVFPAGLYFPRAVEINVVTDGMAQPLAFDMGVFDTTDDFPDLPVDQTMGYSGLRLRAELEKPGIFQEYAVFQGASYFRGIGAGETYGLSARGLALATADPEGEEFPDFIAFWLEQPAPDAGNIVVHALLDSPSCAGAYRFDIRPGEVLRMTVKAHLFAREQMHHIGLAPLTSMFLFDDTMRQRFSDFRPAVHDSDGLLIHNGAGETLWRALSNPTTLQVSAFADTQPLGFGLMQRKRRFSDFNDLEAHYHKRPAVWITPGENWGKGAVTLVEIPADLEIYDNIVAYWRPENGLEAGQDLAFGYTLDWGADPVDATADVPVKVMNTAMGGRPEGGQVIVIDFSDAADLPPDLSKIEISLRTSKGSLSAGVLQRNPETNGARLAFTFDPQGAELAELRAALRLNDAPLSEIWLYRWTKS